MRCLYGDWIGKLKPLFQAYVDSLKKKQKLSEVVVANKFPRMEELLDDVHESFIYSKLDLEGHYEFIVMFRLTNSPTMFQSLINHIFKPSP